MEARRKAVKPVRDMAGIIDGWYRRWSSRDHNTTQNQTEVMHLGTFLAWGLYLKQYYVTILYYKNNIAHI